MKASFHYHGLFVHFKVSVQVLFQLIPWQTLNAIFLIDFLMKQMSINLSAKIFSENETPVSLSQVRKASYCQDCETPPFKDLQGRPNWYA